jgi:hypothetical protein
VVHALRHVWSLEDLELPAHVLAMLPSVGQTR